MIFPLPALITSSGIITAPDAVVPALDGGASTGIVAGGALPTTFEPLAGEVTPADDAGDVAAPLAPSGVIAFEPDAPAALPPDPDELVRPAMAVESELPPPPPHALTPRITPLTMETNSTRLNLIINCYVAETMKIPRRKSRSPVFSNRRLFREYRHLHITTT